MQGFPEEVNEVFQSPKPAGRAYVADGYQCAEIIPKAELCAKISLLLWGLQASPSAWSVGRKRLGGFGGGRHRKTLVAESTRRKERRGQRHFFPGPVVKKWLSSCTNAASHDWGRHRDSCCVLLMPCFGQAGPEQADVPTAGLAVPILQPLSCWPCLGPGLRIQPEKLGCAAVFKIKWFSFHSHKRLQNRTGAGASHIIYAILSPFPSPRRITKGSLFSISSKSAPPRGNLCGIARRRLGFTTPGCQSRNMVRSRVPAGLWLQEPGLWFSILNWVDGALGWSRREPLTSACKGPNAPCPRALFFPSVEQSFYLLLSVKGACAWLQNSSSREGRGQYSMP